MFSTTIIEVVIGGTNQRWRIIFVNLKPIIGTKSTANPAHKTKRIRPCTNSGFRRNSIFNCDDAPRIHICCVLFGRSDFVGHGFVLFVNFGLRRAESKKKIIIKDERPCTIVRAVCPHKSITINGVNIRPTYQCGR